MNDKNPALTLLLHSQEDYKTRINMRLDKHLRIKAELKQIRVERGKCTEVYNELPTSDHRLVGALDLFDLRIGQLINESDVEANQLREDKSFLNHLTEQINLIDG